MATVTITNTSEVDVTISQVECNVLRHGDLGFSASADRDGDLSITVEPCEDCLKEAREEGKREAKE